ncbi:MAG: MBL fold metallo-hydrolase RNA specificity domain-containing protein [Bacteroidota bacterium]
MDVKLKFLGAAQSVTGSKYLLELDNRKILFDCGLFQGKKELRLRNWNSLPVNAKEIDAVIITHAHIDHTGYLPRLVREGYTGPIYCTHATADLMRIMLLDAAKLQEEEAQWAFRQGYSKHSKPEPLFTTEDAEGVHQFVKDYWLDADVNIFPELTIRFRNAGHILGASMVEAWVKGSTQTKKIVFSGDIGRYDDPVMHAPASISEADILVVESTYGDRLNNTDNVEATLTEVIHEAWNTNGAVIIPAFAVGRTQSLTYYFHQLMEKRAIPEMPIYIDSPMAISVTSLYEKHASLHKLEVTPAHGKLISLFDDPRIHLCNTPESSKALNHTRKPMILISASGMCTGGRILHHLYHRLPRENDILLFAGYQAEGTRGRDILEGAASIKIFGEMVPVKCKVREVTGLSAHADQSELMQWLNHFQDAPKMTFITHGELKSAQTFQNLLAEKRGWRSFIPVYLEAFELFTGI